MDAESCERVAEVSGAAIACVPLPVASSLFYIAVGAMPVIRID